MRKLMIYGLCLLLLATAVSALGVTPARSTIQHEDGVVERSFRVLNPGGEAFTLHLSAKGELSDRISLPDTVTIPGGVSERKVTYTIDMQGVEEPGTRKSKIIMSPVGLETEEGETKVNLKVNLVHQVWVEVPYNGTHLESDITVHDKPVIIEMGVTNKGDDVESLEAGMSLDQQGETLAEWQKDFGTLKHGEEAAMQAVYPDQLPVGHYTVNVDLNHERQEQVTKDFLIGDKVLITDIRHDDFTLGEIATIEVDALNIWNEPLDVHGEFTITDGRGRTVSEFSTPVTTLTPEESGAITGFWETQDIQPGQYTMTIALEYEGDRTVQEVQMDIGEKEVQVQRPTSWRRFQESDDTPWMMIIVPALALLIILNAFWIYYFTTRGK